MSTTPARPLPPAVRDKLGKLLPMLSSEPRRRAGRRGGGDRAGAEKQRLRLARSGGEHRSPAPVREPPRRQAPDDDTSTTMDAGELIDLITTVRDSGVWFGPRSETIPRRAARARRRLCIRFHQPEAATLARRPRPQGQGGRAMTAQEVLTLRVTLLRAGYAPIPLYRQGAARVRQEQRAQGTGPLADAGRCLGRSN